MGEVVDCRPGEEIHSNSRSSSFSSVSMLAGSAMGPSLARRAAISLSVLSRSCFFFSWIFFSLDREERWALERQQQRKSLKGETIDYENCLLNVSSKNVFSPVKLLSFSLIQLCDDVGEGAVDPGDDHWKVGWKCLKWPRVWKKKR